MSDAWPIDERTICLTVDVEWACPEVLADLRSLFDARGLRATFFSTGPDLPLEGHEQGIHPNFRADGDCLKAYVAAHGLEGLQDTGAVYRFVVAFFKAFVPEARGVRGHSLHYDSVLLDIYRRAGIVHDSSYQLPLAAELRPFWKECGILELPIFYNDYFDLKTGATGFALAGLALQRPGLKVINVHPNIAFLNAADEAFYLSTKGFYSDPQRLLAARRAGRGARDLLQDLLDEIVRRRLATATLGEVDAAWRHAHPPPWP